MPNDNLLGEITTEKEALAVVRRDGWALSDVPENHKTAELCIEGIKSICRKSLEFVPEALRDEVRRALKSGE